MEQKYAGFGVRLIASLIDGVIVGLGNSAVSYMLQAFMGDSGSLLSFPIGLIISFIYYVWYQHKETQTIGKKLMKLKVITYDGNTPSMFTFFLREQIGKLVSAITLLIGYIMVLWDPKKQALHDKIANTYVVYVSENTTQPTTMTPAQNTTPQEVPTIQTASPAPQNPETPITTT